MNENRTVGDPASQRMAWLLRVRDRLQISALRLGALAALLFLVIFLIKLISVYAEVQPEPRTLWTASVIAAVNCCAIGYASGFIVWSAHRAREDLITLRPLTREREHPVADSILRPLSPRAMTFVVLATITIWVIVNLVFGSIGRQLRGTETVNPLYCWNGPVFMALLLLMTDSFAIMVRMANALARLGRHGVRIDLLATHKLSSFMEIGQRIRLIAVGGLTFLLVQAALVGELATVDWLPPLLLILPLAIWLLVRPMWGIRGAIKEARDAELERLDQELGHRERWPTEAIANPKVEALIRHRERILAVPEWPVTRSALWRPLLYFVIPPLTRSIHESSAAAADSRENTARAPSRCSPYCWYDCAPSSARHTVFSRISSFSRPLSGATNLHEYSGLAWLAAALVENLVDAAL